MSAKISTRAKNVSSTNIVSLIDTGTTRATGYLEIRTGTKPSSPQHPANGILCSTMNFSNPAFAAASNGQVEANPIEVDDNIAENGTVTWFRAYNRDSVAVFDGTITQTGATTNPLLLGDITFENVNFVKGGRAEITTLIGQFNMACVIDTTTPPPPPPPPPPPAPPPPPPPAPPPPPPPPPPPTPSCDSPLYTDNFTLNINDWLGVEAGSIGWNPVTQRLRWTVSPGTTGAVFSRTRSNITGLVPNSVMSVQVTCTFVTGGPGIRLLVGVSLTPTLISGAAGTTATFTVYGRVNAGGTCQWQFNKVQPGTSSPNEQIIELDNVIVCADQVPPPPPPPPPADCNTELYANNFASGIGDFRTTAPSTVSWNSTSGRLKWLVPANAVAPLVSPSRQLIDNLTPHAVVFVRVKVYFENDGAEFVIITNNSNFTKISGNSGDIKIITAFDIARSDGQFLWSFGRQSNVALTAQVIELDDLQICTTGTVNPPPPPPPPPPQTCNDCSFRTLGTYLEIPDGQYAGVYFGSHWLGNGYGQVPNTIYIAHVDTPFMVEFKCLKPSGELTMILGNDEYHATSVDCVGGPRGNSLMIMTFPGDIFGSEADVILNTLLRQ